MSEMGLYKAVFDASPLMNIIVRLRDGVIIELNEVACTILGQDRQQVVGRTGHELGLWIDHQTPLQLLKALSELGAIERKEVPVRAVSKIVALKIHVRSVVLNGDACAIVIGEDVTALRKAEQALRRTQTAASHMDEALVWMDENARIEQVNPAFSRMTGYSPEEAAGRSLIELLVGPSGKHDFKFIDSVNRELMERGLWKGEVWKRRKNGEVFPSWCSVASVEGGGEGTRSYVVVISDYTEQYILKSRLEHAAFHDALTGLPNRTLLHDRLSRSINNAVRSGIGFAVLYIDLDGFKPINDLHGHAAGDAVLTEVARRLLDAVRKIDTVARIAGDEFVVVAEATADARAVHVIAHAVIESLRAPVEHEGLALSVSASVGVAMFPKHGKDAGTLLKRADAALYRCKRAGRGTFMLFEGDNQLRTGVPATSHPIMLDR